MNTHCRIGKVRLKGTNIEVLDVQPRGVDRFSEAKYELDYMLGHFAESGLAGYAIVMWGFKGEWNRSSWAHEDSFVGTTFMPAFVAEVLRRDTINAVIEHDYEIIE